MTNAENIQRKNPLESESIGKLMFQYSLPAIISSLVNSLYNIVDQIFVGHSIGELGNAATNVAFPLVMVITTLAMTFGAGGASAFSLYLGKKDTEQAKSVVGNSMTMLVLTGIAVAVLSLIFLRPLMFFFGGRGQVLEYTLEYTSVTVLGIPFAMIGSGGSQLVHADGSPRYAMAATLTGAVLNCILDPIFIFGFHMGMTGAALATIIGQIISAVLVLAYFPHFKSVGLSRKDYRPRKSSISRIFSLGVAAGANQLAVTVVQIVMNNTLGHYGELSKYGRDIPLACVGIISKVSSIFNSLVFGISQSTQPIIGYNFGAGNYSRVKETFRRAALTISAISMVAFICFQVFPRQIIGIFGKGNDLYYEFALRYFRIFLFCIFIVGLQILSAQFFPSMGKGAVGTVVSLSRQVFFFLPLVVILPLIWGINGVLWAGPIADGASSLLALFLVRREMKRWQV